MFGPDSRPALLLIDMQNAYCHPSGSYSQLGIDVTNLVAVAPKVCCLRNLIREKGFPIVYTQTCFAVDYSDSGLLLEAPEGIQLKNIGHLVQNSWDASLIQELLPLPAQSSSSTETVVSKTRADAFYGTGLAELLKKIEVTAVIVAGVLTHGSVESTVRSAFMHDFQTLVVSNATATFREDDQVNSLTSMRWLGAVVTLAELEVGLGQIRQGSDAERGKELGLRPLEQKESSQGPIL